MSWSEPIKAHSWLLNGMTILKLPFLQWEKWTSNGPVLPVYICIYIYLYILYYLYSFFTVWSVGSLQQKCPVLHLNHFAICMAQEKTKHLGWRLLHKNHAASKVRVDPYTSSWSPSQITQSFTISQSFIHNVLLYFRTVAALQSVMFVEVC